MMLSADGANKNSLAQNDFMSNAFAYMGNDFQTQSQGLNIDYESFFPTNGQLSPSSKFHVDANGHGGLYDDCMKTENSMNAAATLYSSMYQTGRTFPGAGGASELNFAFNQISQYPQNYHQMVGSSKPLQYGSAQSTDFESLQQKISQKKQSLDILQGIIPDPLVLDNAAQEKRYMTSTERIQVPSSDHVAEIVGKNGQRIKQLREQLKVWVKTPSRDEPPIFEVTGLPEKLAEAKTIILRMSEHFTKVQQDRQQRVEPNRIEDRLYVEQDKVGLIVGANGQTIRWVQQLSDTHIATPRKQESIPGLPPPQTYFTICGATEKVKFAKQLICEYVTLRCQGLWLDPELEPSAEASRLVREFHQRRQVEDCNQRKPGSGSATCSAGGGGGGGGPGATGARPVIGSGVDPQMFGAPPPRHQLQPQQHQLATSAAGGQQQQQLTSMRQLISEMDDLWSKPSVIAPPAEQLPAAWNSMLYQATACGIGGMGDRRYSAADVSSGDAGFGSYLQQQPMLLPPMPQQQQQSLNYAAHHAQPAAGLGLIKKSQSDEQVSASPVVGPGWM